MTYFVYENWTRDRARIHRAQCSHCNNGQGTQPSDSGRNCKWHGPIEDRDVAFLLAAKLRREDTKACGTCSP